MVHGTHDVCATQTWLRQSDQICLCRHLHLWIIITNGWHHQQRHIPSSDDYNEWQQIEHVLRHWMQRFHPTWIFSNIEVNQHSFMVWWLRRYNVTLPLHDGHTIIEVCLDQKTSNFPTYSLKKLKFSIIISQVVEKGNYQNFHKWWKKATNPNPNPKLPPLFVAEIHLMIELSTCTTTQDWYISCNWDFFSMNHHHKFRWRTWSWSWATQSLLRYIRIQLI